MRAIRGLEKSSRSARCCCEEEPGERLQEGRHQHQPLKKCREPAVRSIHAGTCTLPGCVRSVQSSYNRKRRQIKSNPRNSLSSYIAVSNYIT